MHSSGIDVGLMIDGLIARLKPLIGEAEDFDIARKDLLRAKRSRSAEEAAVSLALCCEVLVDEVEHAYRMLAKTKRPITAGLQPEGVATCSAPR